MITSVEEIPELAFRTEESELETLRAEIVSFLRDQVDGADADGVVVPVSGGIDSTLSAHLCVEALGPEAVTALVLPCTLTDAENTIDAQSVVERLGVEPTKIQLQPMLDMFEDAVAPEISEQADRRAIGNVIARLRMVVAYYAANVTGRLVCGTSNRTELLLGYFTKHGDGAADIRPIAGLYKTEVRALARHLDVPTDIVEKTPTAGLWAGQTDRRELGAPYGLLDVILHELVENDLGVEGTAATLGVDESFVARYAHRVLENGHKREPVPTPNGDRTGGDALFCELEGRA
ncbi:NAD+ synthase [Natronomonas marina]|jgi:NAD+ synthase|uniref:NAD+ synthase n=1 Tax=Natronomonas marina TaxID=2961939 RepID=UPI0020C9F522|nr:NAD+ synthase [Natronomonas marina]